MNLSAFTLIVAALAQKGVIDNVPPRIGYVYPPGGFDDTEKKPFVSTKLPGVYNIPLRSLYSKDIPNLMMAEGEALVDTLLLQPQHF